MQPTTPTTSTPQAPQAEPPLPAEDADFATEAGPKETEFRKEKEAKDLTSGEFDPIP